MSKVERQARYRAKHRLELRERDRKREGTVKRQLSRLASHAKERGQ